MIEETGPTKRVGKVQFVSEICNHDPMITLHIAALRVDNSKSVIIESWNIGCGNPYMEKPQK